MIQSTSRISSLIQRLEAGETVTQDELRRTAMLQALDVARAGEEYMAAAIESDAKATQDALTLADG